MEDKKGNLPLVVVQKQFLGNKYHFSCHARFLTTRSCALTGGYPLLFQAITTRTRLIKVKMKGPCLTLTSRVLSASR